MIALWAAEAPKNVGVVLYLFVPPNKVHSSSTTYYRVHAISKYELYGLSKKKLTQNYITKLDLTSFRENIKYESSLDGFETVVYPLRCRIDLNKWN